MKVCTRCTQSKSLSDFPLKKRKSGNYHRSSWCKTCSYDSVKNWRLNNREKEAVIKSKYYLKNREKYTLFKYGLTNEDYAEKLFQQNGVCAICEKEEEIKGKHLAVDHCHTTGKIRGLLCGNCNRGIGHLKENVSYLDKAKDYLNNWSKTH